MAGPGPKQRGRLILLLALVSVVAGVAWVLLPAPFSHGLIVGLVLGPLLLAGTVMLLVRSMRARMSTGLEPPPLPAAAWDYVMDLADLDGAPADLRDARGRVLVLNFWSTWCAPCVAEMPALERLRDATADVGVRFAFVTREDPAAVRSFLEKRGFELPVYIASGETPDPFRHRAIPATFVLDRNGTIALRHFGAAAWDGEEVVAWVRTLATVPTRMGSA